MTSFQGFDSQGAIANSALLELLKQDSLIDIISTGRTLKKERKRSVVVLKVDDSQEVFTKLYLDDNPLERLVSTILGSRAHRCHEKALALIKHGISTPTSLGYADFDTGNCTGSAHFTTYLTGGATLSEVIKSSPEQHQYWAEQGFQLVATLHSQGFVHGDLKLNNLMLKDQKLYYIDIDSATKTTRHRARVKDLARFLVALSEAEISPGASQKAFSEYCKIVGLKEQNISPDIKRIARRIQRKHLLKYQRPPRQLL